MPQTLWNTFFLYQGHEYICKVLLLFSMWKIWETSKRLKTRRTKMWGKSSFQVSWRCHKTPPTVFQLLEDEGFTIPQQLTFFPYRETFDFKGMFNRKAGLTNTKKLSWEAKHVPLSVSVCCNVPISTVNPSALFQKETPHSWWEIW